MVRLIKEGYESWKETPFTLFYDGEKHTLSKYTKDQFSDHPKMVIPQYNRETDTLYYIGIIDGEDVGEKFINSSEAMEYLENYYTYSYEYNESAKRNKRRMKEARIGRTKEVKVLQGNWGYGWDDLCEYDKYDNGECKADLKSYQENDPSARYRVIFRRVPNKDYVPTED